MMTHFLALGLLLGLAVSPPAQAGRVTVERLCASVNSSLILSSDVQKFRETVGLRAQLDPLFLGTPLAQKGAAASIGEITDFLIQDRLILQQFPVADSEVELEINSIQSNNHIDRPRLKAALQEQGYRFEDYFDLIRTGVAKRSLLDREIRTKAVVSDDDVRNYYFNHQPAGRKASFTYHVRLMTFSPESYKTTAGMREMAQRAVNRVRAGEAFDEVAKSMSDDPSASSGGDLGEMTDDQMSPQIRNELKKLKTGETSGILGDTKTRLFILKLESVSTAKDTQFEKTKEEIRNQLATVEFQRQIQLWFDRQRQSAFVRKAEGL